MAELDYVNYNDEGVLAAGPIAAARYREVYVDFTETGNQVAGATDSLNLFQVPAGSVVLAAGLEQVTAGSAGNTLVARIGTVTLSGTLASDATAGTITAQADVSGGAPVHVITAVDFNLLSAAAVRATGKARAWIAFLEVKKPTGVPKVSARDQTTGLS